MNGNVQRKWRERESREWMNESERKLVNREWNTVRPFRRVWEGRIQGGSIARMELCSLSTAEIYFWADYIRFSGSDRNHFERTQVTRDPSTIVPHFFCSFSSSSSSCLVFATRVSSLIANWSANRVCTLVFHLYYTNHTYPSSVRFGGSDQLLFHFRKCETIRTREHETGL